MNCSTPTFTQLLELKESARNYLAPLSPFEQPPRSSPEVMGLGSNVGHPGLARGSLLSPQKGLGLGLGLALSKWVVAVTREELAADTADSVFFAG